MCMAKLNLFSRFINMHAFTVKVFVALFRWILYDLAHTTQWAQTAHLLTIEHALEKYFFKPSLVWGERLWHFTGMKFHNTTNNNAKGKCTHLQYFVTNAKTICKSLPRLCPNWIILHLPKEEFEKTEIRHRARDQKWPRLRDPRAATTNAHIWYATMSRVLENDEIQIFPKFTSIERNNFFRLMFIYEVWLKKRTTALYMRN